MHGQETSYDAKPLVERCIHMDALHCRALATQRTPTTSLTMPRRDSPRQRKLRACCAGESLPRSVQCGDTPAPAGRGHSACDDVGQYPPHDRACDGQAHRRAPPLTTRSVGRHGSDDAPGGRCADILWVVGPEGGARGTLLHGALGSTTRAPRRGHTSAILSLVIVSASPAETSEVRARRGQRE